jgi:hypothetical protein
VQFGKRSLIIALKRGRSSFRNFGMLESFIALIKSVSSATFGLFLFNYPAIVRTDFTALIPKS